MKDLSKCTLEEITESLEKTREKFRLATQNRMVTEELRNELEQLERAKTYRGPKPYASFWSESTTSIQNKIDKLLNTKKYPNEYTPLLQKK